MKERLIVLFKLAIAAGVIYWLVTSGRLDVTSFAKVEDRWPWLVAGLALFGLVLWIAAVRWHVLLRAQKIEYTLRRVYSLHMISWFFNQVMLGTLGGDVVRAYMVAREHPEQRGKAILSVFVDRLLGLIVLIAVGFCAMAFFFLTQEDTLAPGSSGKNLRFLAWVLGGCFTGAVVLLVVFFLKGHRAVTWALHRVKWAPLTAFLEKVAASIASYRERPGAVVVALGLSVVLHLCVVVTVILVAHALYDEPPSWTSFFFVVPVANVLMAIPLNPPAAFGTGELIFDELFRWVGVEGGALICLSQRFCQIGWGLVGLAFYVRRKRRVKEALRAAQEATPP